jgi:drug/metabolite transporter (DMT)-like permease
VGDFCGGLASRAVGALFSVAVTQIVGAAGMALVLVLIGQPAPSLPALTWAALAGLSGITGLAAFYRALASGSMSLVAPVAAVIGAGIPAAVGIAAGEPLLPAQSLGIVLAIGAVVVVTAVGGGGGACGLGRRPPELPFTLLAGLGFAGFFLAVDRASAFDPSPWWLLLAVRLAGLAAVLPILARLLRRPGGRPRIDRRLAVLLLLAGLADLGGNAFFVLARYAGFLSVAVVLSSLYPVVTVLLAVAVLRERLRSPQVVGVALALVAIGLIAWPA